MENKHWLIAGVVVAVAAVWIFQKVLVGDDPCDAKLDYVNETYIRNKAIATLYPDAVQSDPDFEYSLLRDAYDSSPCGS